MYNYDIKIDERHTSELTDYTIVSLLSWDTLLPTLTPSAERPSSNACSPSRDECSSKLASRRWSSTSEASYANDWPALPTNCKLDTSSCVLAWLLPGTCNWRKLRMNWQMIMFVNLWEDAVRYQSSEVYLHDWRNTNVGKIGAETLLANSDRFEKVKIAVSTSIFVDELKVSLRC